MVELFPIKRLTMTTEIEAKVEKLGLGKVPRHIFLCADQTTAKCCSKDDSLVSWEYLKRRISELGLDTKSLRTKANCLRVCCKGPIAVVYPEGVWYHSCTPEVIERILTEHVLNNQVVEEFVFARNQGVEGPA
jgi:(2Fe-2S) ferredoxin